MSESNLSFSRYTGDGNKKAYAIANGGEDIGYLRTSDIKVYVDGVLVQSTVLPQTPHIVDLATAPPVGSDVLIRREMPKILPYADFARGNNFGQRQVNNSFLQQLYLTQEVLDGFFGDGFYLKQDLNAGGKRITGVGFAVNDDDVMPRGQADERFVNITGDTLTGTLGGVPATSDEHFPTLLQLSNVVDARINAVTITNPAFLDYGLVTQGVTDNLDYGSL